jgi:hypothetical protein
MFTSMTNTSAPASFPGIGQDGGNLNRGGGKGEGEIYLVSEPACRRLLCYVFGFSVIEPDHLAY